jgi:hypothetical protein
MRKAKLFAIGLCASSVLFAGIARDGESAPTVKAGYKTPIVTAPWPSLAPRTVVFAFQASRAPGAAAPDHSGWNLRPTSGSGRHDPDPVRIAAAQRPAGPLRQHRRRTWLPPA